MTGMREDLERKLHHQQPRMAAGANGLTDAQRDDLRLAIHNSTVPVCPHWGDTGLCYRQADHLSPVVARMVADARAEWERAVLGRFVTAIPATGEAPDYINAAATAMLTTRPAQASASGDQT